METLLKIDLYLHITGGIAALMAGLVAMLAKKGGQIHLKAGIWYYWAMFGVCITALLRFRLESGLLFLTMIAVFSFYNTFSGRRILKYKKEPFAYQKIDWIAAYCTIFCGIAMVVMGIFYGVFYGRITLSILFLAFGLVCISVARNDLLRFKGLIEIQKMHWFFHHIGRMLGSYAATITAFAVTNNHGLLPDLAVWICPGVMIGISADAWANYYRKTWGMPTIAILPIRIVKNIAQKIKMLGLN